MSPNDFKLAKLQFVFFTPNFFISNKSELTAKIKEKYPQANEIILPLPNNIPAEIPFIILTQQDKVEIKIARNRIDFNFFDLENKDAEYINSEFITRVREIFEILNSGSNFLISNMGFIIDSIKILNDSDRFHEANNILKPLFQEDIHNSLVPFDNGSEIDLRNLKKETITLNGNPIKINKIFQVDSAPKKNNKRHNGIFIEFDRNTFPQEGDKRFTWDDISSFISSEKEEYTSFVRMLIEKLSRENPHE